MRASAVARRRRRKKKKKKLVGRPWRNDQQGVSNHSPIAATPCMTFFNSIIPCIHVTLLTFLVDPVGFRR